jgi:hypothetical protein
VWVKCRIAPWLVAGLPTLRPRFDHGLVNVGFLLDEVSLGKVFPPSTSVFPCQFHSTCAPLLGKMKKTNYLITSLHNKPQGSGVSVASTAGPFTKKKVEFLNVKRGGT